MRRKSTLCKKALFASAAHTAATAGPDTSSFFRDLMTPFSNLPSAALSPHVRPVAQPRSLAGLVDRVTRILCPCCLKETRHRSRLRRRHLAREEAANEHERMTAAGEIDEDLYSPLRCMAASPCAAWRAPLCSCADSRASAPRSVRASSACASLARTTGADRRSRRRNAPDETSPPSSFRASSAVPSRDPRSFDPASASSATPPTDRVDPLRVSPSPRHRDRSRRSRAQPRT